MYRPTEHMNPIDDLLHVLHSDGADALRLYVGQPPIVVLDGEDQPLEAPAVTIEDADQILHNIANSRQRRTLRASGSVEFIYTFRERASFVVQARLEGENVEISIH